MPRVLNKPSSWKPQVNVNTKRMKQLMKDVRTDVVARTRNSKDLEQWMQKLAPYTASNCFVTGAHAQPMQEMVNQIAGVVNQTSLPSGSNAEIVKGVMAEACMTMVTNVGEDIKNDLRRIAVDCYNNKLAPRETAKVMGEKIDSFSRARCQAIARTETCRAANLANHINAKEMGAKSYHVICNEGACEYCLAAYGENQDVVYDINDTENLPPYHTNCRCTPTYSMEEPPLTESGEEPVEEPQTTPSIPTTEEARNNLTPTEYQEWKLLNDMWEHGQKFKDSDMPGRVKYALDELERVNNNPRWHELNNKALGKTIVTEPKPEPKPKPKTTPKKSKPKTTTKNKQEQEFTEIANKHKIEYQGLKTYDYDKRNYHTFVEKYDNGHDLTIRIEDKAVNAYNKGGIATCEEIINEVMSVPKVLKQETNEIWFKNTTQGIEHRPTKSGYDTLAINVRGYNISHSMLAKKRRGYDDPNHRIVIHPNNFKGGGTGKYAFIWEQKNGHITDWKHTIHHEFTHSIDKTRKKWENNDRHRTCYDEKYDKVHTKEPYFTAYGNQAREESFAEHGGYISNMLQNPTEQSKKITIEYYEDGKITERDINFKEYKELYPEHYKYFTELFSKGV